MATVAPDREMVLDVRNCGLGAADVQLTVSSRDEVAAKAARFMGDSQRGLGGDGRAGALRRGYHGPGA